MDVLMLLMTTWKSIPALYLAILESRSALIAAHILSKYFNRFTYSISHGVCLACDNHVHIDQTCFWVCGRLLYGTLHQVNSVVGILNRNRSGKAHLGKCLTQSNERFQLSGSSRDSFLIVIQISHGYVGLEQF